MKRLRFSKSRRERLKRAARILGWTAFAAGALFFLMKSDAVHRTAEGFLSPRPETFPLEKPGIPPAFAPKRPEILPRTKAAKMAIILDDWGNNFSLLKDAVSIQRPLTVAILPHLPQSRRIAEEARRRGLGVMLHIPMEPFGAGQPLEPHTIFRTMPDDKIVQYLEEALRSVPYVEGVNNHQGSAATTDPRVMRTVLGYLKRRGLFFVDSHVISKTVGPRIAAEVGIDFAERDVFIDNQAEKEAIKQSLRKAKVLVKRKGEVIVIGHDKKPTLQAIKEMIPELEKEGVQLVLVRELVKGAHGKS
ncbi:MAG: divergent polysaccharide deacetylase family protein [Candidatus Omnitrophica bacterium]|nr:divergent polysaccharide deacetylase family protein [Candidatus Omnitrophota bacterium]